MHSPYSATQPLHSRPRHSRGVRRRASEKPALYQTQRAHHTLTVSGLSGFSMSTSKAGLMPRSPPQLPPGRGALRVVPCTFSIARLPRLVKNACPHSEQPATSPWPRSNRARSPTTANAIVPLPGILEILMQARSRLWSHSQAPRQGHNIVRVVATNPLPFPNQSGPIRHQFFRNVFQNAFLNDPRAVAY